MPDDEIEELLKVAYKKLDAALLLQNDEFYDDAISRAYYAMFYAARSLLVCEGVVVKTHRGMITQIGELYVKNGRMSPDIWKLFASGETLRESAEYGGGNVHSKKSSDVAILNAREFVRVCKEIVDTNHISKI